MFIVISHHWCKPDQVDTARARMDKNATAMIAEPGFIYRYRMERPAYPTCLSAFTAWNDETDYQRYREKRFGPSHDLKASPYDRIETETYYVHATAQK